MVLKNVTRFLSLSCLLLALSGPVVQAQVAPAASGADDLPKGREALFAYDRNAPLAVMEKGSEKGVGFVTRDITFDGLSGAPVAAYVVSPEGKGPFAAVLWVHWLGDPATTNRTEFLAEAKALAAQGVVSVLVDAMWSNAVSPDWFGSRVPEQDHANSIRQVIALRRAMDLLVAQPGVDPARVGIVGHDYGGMYSMLMAGVDRRARAYVYVAVVPSLNDWAFLGPQPKSKAAYVRENADLELTDALREVKGAATLLQFGTKDAYVSRADTGVVAAAAGTRNRRFYDDEHAMTLPQVRLDRDAFLAKELAFEPPPRTEAPVSPVR